MLLSVMRVVGGVLLWVLCVSLCICCVLVSVVQPSCNSECGVLCDL